MLDPPVDLTVAEPGSRTVRTIASAALRRLVRDLLRLDTRGLPDDVSRPLAALRTVVERELREQPGRAFSVLRRPSIGAFVRLLRAPDRLGTAMRTSVAQQLVATLAVELAHAGVALDSVEVDPPHEVGCLGGRFTLPAGPARVAETTWTSDRGTVELPDPGDDLVARPYFGITPTLALATYDDFPLAMFEAHPDKSGNAVDLGGHDPAAWCDALRNAIGIVEQFAPESAAELGLLVQQIIPVGYDEHAHLSASYLESIGTIYMSLHPNEMTMAEAIIHELSHNELNALFELDPVIHNAFSPLFTSPVRPDPRPLHGILLAVHAFVPVEAMYRAMVAAGDPRASRPPFLRRLAQIAQKNREGAEVLSQNARTTAIGDAILDEIRRHTAVA